VTETALLGELMASRNRSVDPRKSPDEIFDLYSIPAFDAGAPVVTQGHEIGSPKQAVEPGDVLLSKIVPHIRRAWVVPPDAGPRAIGSSEWIVFRSERFHPPYLRHLLVSDRFNIAFMGTVAGVGGSLLRARPAHVSNIAIPLPPMEKQRRIAAILDQADELRVKRQAAIVLLDSLNEAVFLDMFGDPFLNPLGWPRRTIGELCHVRGGKRLPKGTPYARGPTPWRYIRVSDFASGKVEADSLPYVSAEVRERIQRYDVRAGDVVLSIAGTIGRVAVIENDVDGALLTENAAKLVPREAHRYAAPYLAQLLRLPSAQASMVSRTGQVTIGKLALFRIAEIPVPVPPLGLQKQYVVASKRVQFSRAPLLASATTLEQLFSSLQHQAFAGQL
jgi:type I restriction enzyme S subunit